MTESMFGGMGGQNVNVNFTADASGYTASLGEMIATTEQYQKVGEGAMALLSKMSVSATKATGALFGQGSAQMSPGVQQAAAMEQAMSGLEAKSKTTGQNFDKVANNVRKMAREMPIGMGGAIQQFEAAQKAGAGTEDQLAKLATATLKVGAASGDLGPGLTESLMQFQRVSDGGLGADKLEAMGDALVTVNAQMGTTAQGTTAFAETFAPVGETLGMTQSQMLGLSSAFEKGGVSGQKAITAFNQVLDGMHGSIRDGGREFEAYANVIGTTNDQFKEMMSVDPSEAVIQFFESIGKGGSDSERTLAKLGFGVRTTQSIRQVAAGGNLRESVSATQSGFGSGAAGEAAEASFGGLNDTIAETNQSLEQLSEAAGRPLVGAFTALAEKTNAVANASATALNSGVGQGAITALTVGGGLLSLGANAAMGLSTVGGGLSMVPSNMAGKAGSFLQRHKSPIMMGAGGAAATGFMTGNPMMGTLGTLAMITAMQPGTIAKTKELMGKGLNYFGTKPMGDAKSKFWGGRTIDMRIGDSVSNIAKSSTQVGYQMPKDMEKRLQGNTYQARRLERDFSRIAESNQTNDQKRADMQRASDARTSRVNSLTSRSATFGATAANLGGSMAMSLIGGGAMATALPWMLGIGAVGGLGFAGYKKYKKNKELDEFAEDETNKFQGVFSEKLGVAAASADGFASAVREATSAVSTYGRAFTVTEQDISAAREDDLKITEQEQFKEFANLFENANNNQGDMEALIGLAATAVSGQSPEYTNKVLANFAESSQMSAAQMEEFVAKMKGTGSPLGNMVGTSSDAEQNRREFVFGGPRQEGTLTNQSERGWFDQGTPQEALMVAGKSLGEAEKIAAEQTADAFGASAGAEQTSEDIRATVDQYMDNYNQGNTQEKEASKRGLKAYLEEHSGATGYTGEQLDDIVDNLGQEDLYLPEGTSYEDLLPGEKSRYDRARGTSGESLDQLLANVEAVAGDREGERQGAYVEWATGGQDYGKTGPTNRGSMQGAGELAMWAKENNVEMSELVAAIGKGPDAEGNYDSVQDSGNQKDVTIPVALVGETANNMNKFSEASLKYIQGYENPESGATAAAVRKEVMGGTTNTGASGLGDRVAAGTIAQEALTELGNAQAGSQTAEFNQQKLTQAVALMDENAKEQTTGVAAMEKIAVFGEAGRRFAAGDSSPEQEESDRLAYEQMTAAEDAIRAQAKQQVMAQINYDKQLSRMQEDQQRQEQYMLEDHLQQKSYMVEDHETNKARTIRNFNKNSEFQTEQFQQNREWQQEDFELQVERREEDFGRNRMRAEEDREKNLQRQRQDFAQSQLRAAQDLAKNMFDVYNRRQYSAVTSFGSVTRNMNEQNADLQKQQDVVNQLKNRGLSQAAIDGLGLADPKNLDQALYWGSSAISDDDIAEMNASWMERQQISNQNNANSVQGRRAREDFIKSRDREAFDWEQGRQRELDDYFRDSDRMWEDHIRQRKRQKKQFKKQQEFQRDQLRDSLRDSDDDLRKSLNRADRQFEKSMNRMREALSVNLGRMKTDFKDSMDQLVITTEEAMGLVSGEIDLGSKNWRNNLAPALGGMEKDQDESWGRSKTIHSSSLKTIYKWYKDFAKDGTYNTPDNTTPPSKKNSNTGSGSSAGETRIRGAGSPGAHSGNVSSQGVSGSGAGGPSFVSGDHAAGEVGSVNWGSTGDTLDAILKNFQDLQSTLAEYYGGFGRGGDGEGVLQDGEGARQSGKTSFKAADFIFKNWPVAGIGGSRASDPYPGHPAGRAIDVMIPNYHSERGIAMGDEIVQWAQDNVGPLNLAYLIWRQRQWTPYGGWSNQGDRGGDTPNHMDHVHLEWKTRGGNAGPLAGGRPSGPMAPDYNDDDGLWSLIDKNARERDLNKDDIGDFTGKKLAPLKPRGGSKGGYAFPLPTGTYGGNTRTPYGHHDGANPQDLGAGEGVDVYSSIGGRVTEAGWQAARGYHALVENDAWNTRYYHFVRPPSVKVGDMVDPGELLGYVGNTGASEGNHLHWEMHPRFGVPYNTNRGLKPLGVMDAVGIKHYFTGHQNAPNYDPKYFADGGVVTGTTHAVIGEAGDSEAVIPLNQRGVEVIAEAIGKYAHSFEAKAAQTAPYAQQIVTNTTINDHSTQVNGPITVESNSVGELMGEIRTKSRMSRLSSPVGDHG